MIKTLFAVFCSLIITLPLAGQQLSENPSTTDLKRLSIEELMNIEVISVSKRPEKLHEAASAIQVITYDDIKQSGATSIPEALRLANNLQVAQVNSSQWAISARGFNNVLANKLLVLIDGRVLYTPMYAGVFWDVQNILLEDVDRIEVISGPGGTLWGANAVNGVINIITKNSKDTKGLFAEVGMGSELPWTANLRYGGNILEKLSCRVYGTTFKRGDTRLVDSIQANDNWKMAQTGFRMDWDAPDNSQLMIQANLYSDRPDPDGGKPVLANGSNIVALWTKSFSEHEDLQLQVYYDNTFRDFRNEFAEKLRTYDLDGQHRFRILKRNEIVWGLGFRLMDHEVKNLEFFAFRPAHKQLHLFSAFVQDEIKMMRDHFRLTIGSKFEHTTYAGFQVQPNLRLAWTSRQQTIWGAASHAIRTPARIDREFFLNLTSDIAIIAGADFSPEKVWAYELGWRLQTHTTTLSLSAFYNVYDDIRSAEPNGALVYPFTIGNGVEGDTHGAELSGVYQVTEWCRLKGGYTFLRKELMVKPGSSDLNQGTAESNDPEHQFLIQSSMKLFKRVEWGTVFRYVADLPKPAVSAYAQVDVRVAWKINNWLMASVVGQNLLKNAHTEFIPSSPSPRQIERSIYGKITVNI